MDRGAWQATVRHNLAIKQLYTYIYIYIYYHEQGKSLKKFKKMNTD